MHQSMHFDNSANNKYNPDPGKEVHFGEQTWEEMMIGFFEVSFDPGKKPDGHYRFQGKAEESYRIDCGLRYDASSQPMNIPHQSLESFAERILQAVGVSEPKASLVAHSLVVANLRGVDSHGLQLLPFYVEQMEHGNINVAADGHVASETGGCLVYEGENGIGQVIAEQCCHHAVRLAKMHGIAIVVARESNHFGAAAFWARASLRGRNARPGDVQRLAACRCPGKAKNRASGPIRFAYRFPGRTPGCWTLATTTVAAGKIFRAHFNQQTAIPEGWAMDAEGVPTTSTETAMNGLLMPLGGYKGSGLAMMVELFSAVLGGGAMSTQLGGIRVFGQPARVGQILSCHRCHAFYARRRVSRPRRRFGGDDEVLRAGERLRRSASRRRAGMANRA